MISKSPVRPGNKAAYLFFQIYIQFFYVYAKDLQYKKDVRFMNVFFITVVLQHYLSNDEIREPFLVCITLGLSLGTLTINSSSRQSRASHMRSKCSKLTLSTNSWYNSLIVFGRIPVALAKSACVHLISPSLIDNKILIIRRRSFRYKITHFDITVLICYFIAV